MIEKTGWSACIAWDKTFKPHHLPLWAKKKLRQKAIAAGTWIPHTRPHSLLDRDLFDHWGSVKRGTTRALVSQPYCDPDELAQQWAEEMDCTLESFRPAPWAAAACCYIFTPPLA